jgi:hypothetical protein
MEKITVVDALIDELRTDFNAAVEAQKEAAEYATSEESRAREKYETQSTEASYLARGQAAMAKELSAAIQWFVECRANFAEPHIRADIGSLIQVDLAGYKEWLFMAKVAGGHSIAVDGQTVTIITLESPIGRALFDQKTGANFVLPNGSKGSVLSVS